RRTRRRTCAGSFAIVCTISVGAWSSYWVSVIDAAWTSIPNQIIFGMAGSFRLRLWPRGCGYSPRLTRGLANVSRPFHLVFDSAPLDTAPGATDPVGASSALRRRPRPRAPPARGAGVPPAPPGPGRRRAARPRPARARGRAGGPHPRPALL